MSKLDRDDLRIAKDLSARSDVLGLRQLIGHFSIIGVGIGFVAISETWIETLAAQIVLGIGLTFLFAPAHETVHRTAFKSKWLNDVVGNIAGAILILPPIYFRHYHLAHHRFTQIPGKDPELLGKRIASRGDFLWHVTGLPYWLAMITGLLRRAFGNAEDHFIEDRNRAEIITEARRYVAGYFAALVLSVWFGTSLLLAFWIVPVLLTQPFLRLYLLAEHKLCTEDTDPFTNTRTVLTNPIIRFLAWNMPYHVEHHAHMAVPFHALPAFHQQLKARTKNLSLGYRTFYRDYLRSLS